MNGLIFITHQTKDIDCLQSVRMALDGGCTQIQLRMKESPVEDVLKTAAKAKELCDQYDARLFVDDHVSVCKEVVAAGVHLGKSDMPPAEARKILGNNFIIGGTANTMADIQHLYEQGVDYIGLGPFRYTQTKKNLSPILGLEGYKTILQQCRDNNINLPVFAIGGIVAADISALMDTGIAGMALSSTILNATDPVEETKRIIKQLNTYRK